MGELCCHRNKNVKGNKGFALSGNVKRTGLVEIPMGMNNERDNI